MSRILLFLFLLPSSVLAYQIAYVKESRALIYADPELINPIGFISKGKKIQVGEVKRNNGRALPLVLSGKVVFIKIEDLAFKDEKTEKFVASEGEHFIEEEKEEKEYLEPIRLALNLEFMDPGSQWDELVSLTGGSSSALTQIEVLLELRLTQSRFFFDGGFIYSTLNSGSYSFESLGFKALAQYRLLNLEFLDFDLNAGFHFAPGGAKLKYDGVYDNGNYWGYLIGAQARFLPKSTWSINLGVNYSLIALNELDTIQLPQGEFVFNQFKGMGLYFGVSFPL